jgi:CRP-like cAMP-binding protein
MRNNIPFVHLIDDARLKTLCNGVLYASYPAGQRIIREGEAGSTFYFIFAGAVRCRLGNDLEVTELGAGCFFGEQACLRDDRLRQLTCIASDRRARTEVGVVSFPLFQRCLRTAMLDSQWTRLNEYKVQVARATELRHEAYLQRSQLKSQKGRAFMPGGKNRMTLHKMMRRIYFCVRFLLGLHAKIFEKSGKVLWKDTWEAKANGNEVQHFGLFIGSQATKYLSRAVCTNHGELQEVATGDKAIGEIRLLQEVTGRGWTEKVRVGGGNSGGGGGGGSDAEGGAGTAKGGAGKGKRVVHGAKSIVGGTVAGAEGLVGPRGGDADTKSLVRAMHQARAGIEQGQTISGRLQSKVRRALRKPPLQRSNEDLQVLTRYVGKYWAGQDDPLREIPEVHRFNMSRYLGYKRFLPGAVITAAGSKAQTVYVVLSGEVVLSTTHSQERVTLRAGEAFGEMALLGHAMDPRAHTTAAVPWMPPPHQQVVELWRQQQLADGDSTAAEDVYACEVVMMSRRVYKHCLSGVIKHQQRRKLQFLEQQRCFRGIPKPKVNRIAFSMLGHSIAEHTKLAQGSSGFGTSGSGGGSRGGDGGEGEGGGDGGGGEIGAVHPRYLARLGSYPRKLMECAQGEDVHSLAGRLWFVMSGELKLVLRTQTKTGTAGGGRGEARERRNKVRRQQGGGVQRKQRRGEQNAGRSESRTGKGTRVKDGVCEEDGGGGGGDSDDSDGNDDDDGDGEKRLVLLLGPNDFFGAVGLMGQVLRKRAKMGAGKEEQDDDEYRSVHHSCTDIYHALYSYNNYYGRAACSVIHCTHTVLIHCTHTLYSHAVLYRYLRRPRRS